MPVETFGLLLMAVVLSLILLMVEFSGSNSTTGCSCISPYRIIKHMMLSKSACHTHPFFAALTTEAALVLTSNLVNVKLNHKGR